MAWAQGILSDLERRWPATWRQAPGLRGRNAARFKPPSPDGQVDITEAKQTLLRRLGYLK